MDKVWFELMWNASIDALDLAGDAALSTEHPLFGVMETMHGIAEDQPHLTHPNGYLKHI